MEKNSDKKQCSKCKAFQPLDRFKEDRKQCNICLESKRRYREKHREELQQKAKEYYQQNKDKVKERTKTYKEQNRDTIVEKNKQYREDHKEEIKQKKKEYYEQNKEQIQEKQKKYKDQKVECPICKTMVAKYQMKRHEQNLVHQRKLKAYTPEQLRFIRDCVDSLEPITTP